MEMNQSEKSDKTTDFEKEALTHGKIFGGSDAKGDTKKEELPPMGQDVLNNTLRQNPAVTNESVPIQNTIPAENTVSNSNPPLIQNEIASNPVAISNGPIVQPTIQDAINDVQNNDNINPWNGIQ
jgi:hypothetical protein